MKAVFRNFCVVFVGLVKNCDFKQIAKHRKDRKEDRIVLNFLYLLGKNKSEAKESKENSENHHFGERSGDSGFNYCDN